MGKKVLQASSNTRSLLELKLVKYEYLRLIT